MYAGNPGDRLSGRHEVLLSARCRKSPWKVFDVEIGNLGAGGCSILRSRESFAQGEEVTLRFAHLKPRKARVRWVRDGAVGIEFVRALAPATITELNARYGLSMAVPQDPA
ncbi:PilZ domain-containing protein [Novosphingobium mangrovi (ex Hu et al. 2023)]|uniref:PilZ domain-containing protein n=1 Tax=Novosphingobium mangrovi (ex Hu et al. 2023) TaxID=2930094 RepID=A0ABT0A9E0_9SPHN|nr:PilZ domain-containing protein [Novosphingobium mangrovi (ex Hu et al. 2023)]MCJ1959807.1 PilZ domain-containing protein [Novosphingobium mangrovi (ex Hu et al. 2023)]